MHTRIDPPLSSWHVAPRRDAARDQLVEIIDAGAEAFELGPMTRTGAIVATGHQAQLWHPGILAKFIAASHTAGRFIPIAFGMMIDSILVNFFAYQGFSIGILTSFGMVISMALLYWFTLPKFGELLEQREKIILSKLMKMKA